MATLTSIFISAVAKEFSDARKKLRDLLTRAEIFSKIQEHFHHDASDTLVKMDKVIAKCDLLSISSGNSPELR
jgi:hypothetical protein